MQVKMFEIRDAATFIPCIGIAMHTPESEKEHFLLRRSGFSPDIPLILFVRADGGPSRYDPYGWPDPRTMPTAHRYVADHWNELESGAVIDVEYILGETDTKKISERLTAGGRA